MAPHTHDNSAAFNGFRITGDLTHLLSKAVLIWSIHRNRSAEGISLITQMLYAVVFCSRYTDLLNPRVWYPENFSAWNLIFKTLYISTSLYIIYMMMRIFARSREREKAWKFGAICLAGSLVSAPFVMMIFTGKKSWSFRATVRTFSEILESVCILPQLILLRQTSIPTVIDSFYLVLLGTYRVFYIMNWIYRGMREEGEPSPIDATFGVIQVLFYLDFAWVYWTRQRVKLRNGSVVDQDDMSRGYLVGKILGRHSISDEVDGGEDGQGNGRGWAGRGISISADEEIAGSPPQARRFNDTPARNEERSSIMRGEQRELDFEDDEDSAPANGKNTRPDGITGGEEWRGAEGR